MDEATLIDFMGRSGYFICSLFLYRPNIPGSRNIKNINCKIMRATEKNVTK